MGAGREQIDRAGPPNPWRLHCILSRRGLWGGAAGCGCQPDAPPAINKGGTCNEHPWSHFNNREVRCWCAATEAEASNQRLSIHYTLRQGYQMVVRGSNRALKSFHRGPLSDSANWKQYRLIYWIKCVRPVYISPNSGINYRVLQ